ncbi:MAG TPA: DUF2252 family protein [Sandaracinaceae bacterium LLY-WYZ-13_1]|nr:DUF2252 family protein [Sandaracinaceae bacterium LLY-WYZ-13_1]
MDVAHLVRAGLTALVALAVLGCGAAPCECPAPARGGATEAPAPRDGRLYGPRELEAARASAELRARLRRDVHAFLRLTNRRFVAEVCRAFRAELPPIPIVNLHGDLHLEQYAVTADGRGIADFDDAALGPPVVDLVRLATSVHLVADERGWDPEPPIDAMLAGYRRSLEHPEEPVPEPPLAATLRAQMPSRAVFLARTEALMGPLDPDVADEFDRGYERYVELMRAERPGLRDGFFDLVSRGQVRAGVGSTLVPRLLVRVAGPTDGPDDDVILEAKELGTFPPSSCVQRMGGAWRVVLTQARLGLGSTTLLAVVPRGPDAEVGDRPFWVQRWRHDYRELDVERDLTAPAQLEAVAHDIGHRLGHGHVVYVGAPLDSQLRRALSSSLDAMDSFVEEHAADLATRTRVDRRRFLETIDE